MTLRGWRHDEKKRELAAKFTVAALNIKIINDEAFFFLIGFSRLWLIPYSVSILGVEEELEKFSVKWNFKWKTTRFEFYAAAAVLRVHKKLPAFRSNCNERALPFLRKAKIMMNCSLRTWKLNFMIMRSVTTKVLRYYWRNIRSGLDLFRDPHVYEVFNFPVLWHI